MSIAGSQIWFGKGLFAFRIPNSAFRLCFPLICLSEDSYDFRMDRLEWKNFIHKASFTCSLRLSLGLRSYVTRGASVRSIRRCTMDPADPGRPGVPCTFMENSDVEWPKSNCPRALPQPDLRITANSVSHHNIIFITSPSPPYYDLNTRLLHSYHNSNTLPSRLQPITLHDLNGLKPVRRAFIQPVRRAASNTGQIEFSYI